MATSGISILTRRELDAGRRFSLWVSLLVPAVAILLQCYVPLRLHAFTYLDLPLLVTIFFAVARRNPLAGTVTGMVIGVVQDAISGLPIGINGIADTVVGYIGSSLSLKLEIEQPGPRILMIFGFKFLHDAVYFLIQSRIVGSELMYRSRWEVYSALANAIVGVFLMHQLDKLKKRS
ncbi:MAG: rod shape-determining protein MreD [Acidobacteriales bacterium]|nr:rod shape-determining protein MreD [Terriglobales bacterium]